MRPGAQTPEELDALLEDAFVLRDRRALAALFESDALLVDATAGKARGAGEIASWATETWTRDLTYVAAEPRVLQAGDTALILTAEGIAVARRHDDRAWRYAIALLSVEVDHATAKEEQ
jgi:ketosteroid isomerase-like protein